MSPAGKARMRTSTPGTRRSPGFTFIELSIVLFVLGLLLWLVVPRISSVAGPPRGLSEGLTITGVRIEGEDRPPDIVTEIRYLPGGKIPAFRIFFRESGGGANPPEWTLRVTPTDGLGDLLDRHIQ